MKKIIILLIPLITLYAQVIDTVIRFTDEPHELLYIPDGNELYINFRRNNYHLVLDCSTYTIKKTIVRPAGYEGSAFGIWNERRNKIYFTFNPRPESIAVIDNSTDSIIKWINFRSWGPLCYNSRDDKIYAFGGVQGVGVIDCATDSIIKIITQPYSLSGFVLWDSIGNKVYCGSGIFHDLVTVINCANDSVIAIISTNVYGPTGAVSNIYRRKLYVGGDNDVGAVIDELADTLIKNYQPIYYSFKIPLIWNSLEDKVYWPNYDSIYVINCQNDSIIKYVELSEHSMRCMYLLSLRNRLYATIYNRDSSFNLLYVLDCRNDSVISQMRFGRIAVSITYNSQNHRIYIADQHDSVLYVFRDEIIGVEESMTLKALHTISEIYPNPAQLVLNIRMPFSGMEEKYFKIFDVTGKLVSEIASPPSVTRYGKMKESEISLKSINPGIYFLQFGTEIRKFLVIK